MDDQNLNWARLALVAFVGALILEVVLTFATGLKAAFTVRQIPAHLAALLVGSLAGWLFELFREMTKVTHEALRVAAHLEVSIRALTTKITYQDEALGMLTSCPRHNEALTSLIQASMGENFRNIPLVGVSSYLEFLRKAIEHSDGYEGIQRKPLSWYKLTGAGSYLGDLKRRDMEYKKRLLIIDKDDEDQMKADLADHGVLEYYWSNTGAVTTYWMTSRDFVANFPGMKIPEDLALYDKRLLIAYDEGTKILTFDVIDKESSVRRLFDAVDQLEPYEVGFLHELAIADYVRR